MLQFTHDCVAEGAGYSFFAILIRNLRLPEKVLDVEHSVLTPLVCCAVEGVKRHRVKERGIVKKATGYSWAIFVNLIEKEVVLHADTPDRIDAFHFPSLISWQ